jgi:hypothetical protein
MPRKPKLFIIGAAVAAVLIVTTMNASSARADQIYIVLVKAGKLLSGYGSGSLFSHGRRQRLAIEGVNFDALPRPKVRIEGNILNLRHSSDIAGNYRAASGGTSIVSASVRARLENKDGVALELHLLKEDERVTLDLAGLTITPQ